MQTWKSFEHKTILLTGAFGGLGRKFIKYLLHSNARLILTDKHCPPREDVFDSENIDAVYKKNVLGCIDTDLTESGCGKKLFDACEAIASVDMIIHNAGIGFGGYYEDIPWDKVELQMRVMLQAPMEITHHFLPGFIARRSGHLVFISSVAGFVATPFGTPYSTAKFGLKAFAMALHGESHTRGLDVSIVYPFFTRTDILNSEAYGNPPVKTMPGFFIEDPDKIIRSVLDAVAAKKLHIFPGNYSRLLWNASKFYPLIAPQMKAPGR